MPPPPRGRRRRCGRVVAPRGPVAWGRFFQSAGALAQSVEHRTFNPLVDGSIPSRPIKINKLKERRHDLRHATASMVAAQGASRLEIADVLGHRTLATVKRYSHLIVDHKAKIIEKMIAAKGL